MIREYLASSLLRTMRWAMTRGAPLPMETTSAKPMLFNFETGNLDVHPIDTKDDQLDNYMGWVYGAVSTIAADVRANPWGIWKKVGQDRDDWEEIDPDKLPNATARAILERPNLRQTWGQFRELRQIHKDLTGEAYWHLITNEAGGPPIGIELIQPDWVEEPIFNTQKTSVIAWRINSSSGSFQIDAQDLIPDFYPNPRDPSRGMSPVEAFGLAQTLDVYMRAYGAKLIRDGSFFGQYLKVAGDLDEENARAKEDQLQSKFRTPGRFAVFGNNAEIGTAPMPFRDLDMLRILRPSRDQILGIYKVPPSKFGLTEGQGVVNQELADQNYQRNALRPRFRVEDEIMNSVILPRLMGPQSAQFWYENEDPVEDDREWELKRALDRLKAGTITVNKFHQEIGEDEIGPSGEVYMIPSTSRVVKDLAEEAERNGAVDDPDPNNERQLRAARRQTSRERFDNKQGVRERAMTGRVRSLFSRELKALRAGLEENADSLRDLQTYPGIPRTLTLLESYGQEFDWPTPEKRDWIDRIMDDMATEWKSMVEEEVHSSTRVGWSLLNEEVAGALSFSVGNQKALEFARRVAGAKVVGITNVTKLGVRDVISEGDAEGLTIDEMSRNLVTLYDDFKGARASNIARTETANAMNWGKHANARESGRRLGMKIVRSWVATLDDRTREDHFRADESNDSRNRDIPMDELYTVGGISMFHPGDPGAPAAQVINCRCTETYRDMDA